MTLQWASVTTVHAPAWLIRLHAAYLKLLGAGLCVYFIDNPASYAEAELADLSRHAKLCLCDEAYWQSVGGRPEDLPERQLKNLRFARAQVDARWFLHLDIDEFLHFTGDLGRVLDSAPAELSEFHFQNVERLIVRPGARWHEGVLRVPNFDTELQARHYGQRAPFLGAGLASYFHGKSLVKGGPRVIQGVHSGMSVRPQFELVRMTIPLHQGFLVHYPCISPQHLVHRLRRNRFRMPDVRKFRHEHMLDTFLFGPVAKPRNIEIAAAQLHTCSRQDALAWSEAGLCRPMPDAYRQLLEQAAGEPEILDIGFAERSFAAFYRD